MRKVASILLVLLVTGATALAGCTSFGDYVDKKGVLKFYIAVTSQQGDIDDFRAVDLAFDSFVLKRASEAGTFPDRHTVDRTIDIGNLGGYTLAYETRLDIGTYDLASMIAKIKTATLKDGTTVTVAVPPDGVYAPSAPVTTFSIGRAEETAVKVTFYVKLNTEADPGPDGEYFLTWDHTRSGPFTP